MKQYYTSISLLLFCLFLNLPLSAQLNNGTYLDVNYYSTSSNLVQKLSFLSGTAVQDDGKVWLTCGDKHFNYPISFKSPFGYYFHDSINFVDGLSNQLHCQAYDVKRLSATHFAFAWTGGIYHLIDDQWKTDDFVGSDTVFCIAGTEKFWAAGTSNGIILCKNNTYSRYTMDPSGKSIGRITSIAMDENDVIYAGGDEGILRYSDGQAQRYHVKNSVLNSNSISSIVIQKTRVWFASADETVMEHLYYMETNGSNLNSIPALSCDQWLSSLPIFRLNLDRAGGVWYAFHTENDLIYGIVQIQPDHFELRQLHQEYISFYNKSRDDYPFIEKDNGDFVFLPQHMRFNPLENGRYLDSTAPVHLDINEVSVPIRSIPAEFWSGYGPDHSFQVPKNSCRGTLYAGSPWFGAKGGDNTIYTSAATYYDSDFYYGILDPNTGMPDTAVNHQLYLEKPRRIYRRDIDAFKFAWDQGQVQNNSYTIPASILNWPGTRGLNSTEMLAPFFDRNGDKKYNPMDGDYPLIKGDQAVFTVFNDQHFHGETFSAPIGIEVAFMSYAYNCNDITPSDSLSALNYTTFHEYTVHNFSPRDYPEFVVGQWIDFDLGNYIDDRIGADTNLDVMYVYNGKNNDDGSTGYGENPPTQSLMFLDRKMNQMTYFNNDFSVIGNPTMKEHYFNYLIGLDKDGNPLQDPNGHTWRDLTGDPYNPAQYRDTLSDDKRGVAAMAPVALNSGQSIKLTLALVYSRDADHPNGSNTSYKKMIDDLTRVRNWYREDRFPQCDGVGSGVQLPEEGKMILYPNPGNSQLRVKLPASEEIQQIDVYDLQGRLVLHNSTGEDNLETAGLTAGRYIIRVVGSAQTYSGIWVKVQ
ncbi:MAG: T9SS type A sorting domain-containing protein [Bacteroidetes bacterium]|nr:T9SS type A sorting domain-containing protein [Bacteroidota bacterium]